MAVGYLMIGLAPNKTVLYLGRIISTCALSLHVAAEGLYYYILKYIGFFGFFQNYVPIF